MWLIVDGLGGPVLVVLSERFAHRWRHDEASLARLVSEMFSPVTLCGNG